jgi:glycosidase
MRRALSLLLTAALAAEPAAASAQVLASPEGALSPAAALAPMGGAPLPAPARFIPPVGRCGPVARVARPASARLPARRIAASGVAVRRAVRLGLRRAGIDASEPEIGWAQIPPAPAGAPGSLAEASLLPLPGMSYTPSPVDWAREIFYSIILDRFGRAEPYRSWGDPASADTRHGGNIRGLIERLDYLQGLGVTTLQVNPLYLCPPAAYHQYWPVHFMAVDPGLGTMDDFRELVRKAHARGMRVVLDMVFNHTGPVIEYEGGWRYGSHPKAVKSWKYPLKPSELARPENFHRRGSIEDWHNEEQTRYGDFPGGLNHLATDNPATQDLLLHVAKWWIKETDVDGFRLDTYPHVSRLFWDRFFPEVRAFAAGLGKKNFLIMGEIFHGDPYALSGELGRGRLDAAYDYPAYFWDQEALHGRSPTSALESSLKGCLAALGDSVHRLIRFLDNHDKPRFLGPGEPLELLRLALAYVLFSIGIPFIYYGTEQGWRSSGKDQPLDSYREDMFPGGRYKNPAAGGDNFNPGSPLYKEIARMAALRRSLPALSLGSEFVRWADPFGPGIFAFSRIYQGEEVVVVLNTRDSTRWAEMWVDSNLSPPGTVFLDGMSESEDQATQAYAKDGGSKIGVSMGPRQVRVLVRKKT